VSTLSAVEGPPTISSEVEKWVRYQSAIGNRQSAIGNRQSAVGSRQSKIGNRRSAIDPPSLLHFIQKLRRAKQSTIENKKQKAKSKKQDAALLPHRGNGSVDKIELDKN
jgi:hypothetical protein